MAKYCCGDRRQSLLEQYSAHAVKNTCCHFLTCWFIILVISGLGATLFPFLYPNNGSAPGLEDPNSPAKIDFDGRALAQSLYLASDEAKDATDESTFSFIYQSADGGDLFTPERIQTMCILEQTVFSEAVLPPSCDTETSLETCVTQKSGLVGSSIASIFYAYDPSEPATEWDPNLINFNLTSEQRLVDINLFPKTKIGPTGVPVGLAGFNASSCTLLPQANVDYVKARIFDALDYEDLFFLYGFFLKRGSQTQGFTQDSRSFLKFSTLRNDTSDTAEKLAQRVNNKLFELLDLQSGFQRSAYRDDATLNGIRVIYLELSLITTEFQGMISGDFTMVVFSFGFVFIWMWIYTRSILVTIPCILGIVFAFVASVGVYKVIFRIEYFDFLQILLIYVILGIGADDVFVVFDCWHQSEVQSSNEVERFKYTIRRSSQSVFNTSFTTAAAFAVTAATPLVAISSFGVFAAITVIMCYLFTLTIFPVTMLLVDRRKRRFQSGRTKQAGTSKDLLTAQKRDRVKLEDLRSGRNSILSHWYIPFVKRFDKVLVIIGLLVGIAGGLGLMNFSPLTEAEQFLPPDHMLARFFNLGTNWLAGSTGEYAEIDAYWGVAGIDRDIWSRYTGEPERYKDVLRFDEAFDLSDPAAQQTASALCATLEEETCSLTGCSGSTVLLPGGSHVCTIDQFHTWWFDTFNNTDYDFPGKNTFQRNEFFSRLAQFRDENGMEDFIGFINGDLRYFGMRFVTTINPTDPASVVSPIEKKIGGVVKASTDAGPDTAQNLRVASQKFVQNSSEQDLVNNAIRGLGITFPIVFAVLLVATDNWILATMASISIAFVVIATLGSIFTFAGWELGLTESIATIMIVGLSVDYTVHLAHMYTFAGEHEGLETRGERFEYAMLTMGVTVFGGGVTTLGAGIFLLGCQITFFFKIGTLLVLTVLFSLYFSMGFLMPLCNLLGPQGDSGRFLCSAK